MKIKMLEHFQGTGVSAVLVRTGNQVNALEPGEIYEVDNVTGAYLLDNRKGEEVKEAAHYGGKQGKPELRDDEKLYEQMAKESQAEEPLAKTKRGKK